jgi:hypothetical protein
MNFKIIITRREAFKTKKIMIKPIIYKDLGDNHAVTKKKRKVLKFCPFKFVKIMKFFS